MFLHITCDLSHAPPPTAGFMECVPSWHQNGEVTNSFIVGCITSHWCGWVGMTNAAKTNIKSTYKGRAKQEESRLCFSVSIQDGSVMGLSFGLARGSRSASLARIGRFGLKYLLCSKSMDVMLVDIAGYGVGSSLFFFRPSRKLFPHESGQSQCRVGLSGSFECCNSFEHCGFLE